MRYDPDRAPDPELWLALDESERIDAVDAYHRRVEERVPDHLLHAAFHTIVETQLAMAMPAVTDALVRLRADGLSRHDAVHAIGSVLAAEMFELMQPDAPPDVDVNARYEAALRELTAASWLASGDE